MDKCKFLKEFLDLRGQDYHNNLNVAIFQSCRKKEIWGSRSAEWLGGVGILKG